LVLCRLKQWLKIASFYGDFPAFDQIKRADSVSELLAGVQKSTIQNML
jgi:hypothetical protein